MRKIGIIAVLSLLVLAIAAVPVLAQTGGVHFTKNNFPSCTISGTTADASRNITCTSELAGLGNEDLSTTTLGSGSVTYFCGTPGSGNIAPGQNKSPATLSGTSPNVVPAAQLKGGRAFATDSVTLNAPPATPEQAGCKKNWQVVGTGLAITGVTYTVEQGGVTLITCQRTGTNLDDFTFARNQCEGPAL